MTTPTDYARGYADGIARAADLLRTLAAADLESANAPTPPGVDDDDWDRATARHYTIAVSRMGSAAAVRALPIPGAPTIAGPTTLTVNPCPGTFDVPLDAIVAEGSTLPPLAANPLYSRDVADNVVSFFHDLGDRRTAYVIGCDAADGGGWATRVEGIVGSEAEGATKGEAINRAAEKAAAILAGGGLK